MSVLSKLTIVIFTYNRHPYVIRNLGLWSGSEVQVNVLDGSAEAISINRLNTFASNIHYHHLPLPIWERISAGAALVHTEYVAFLPDDEFFIPSALEASIVELDANPDLVSCSGRGIDKSLGADLIVPWATIEHNEFNYKNGNSGAVEQLDPIVRMIAHMSSYVPSTFYGVSRSQPWIEVVLLLSQREFSSGVAPEIQFELSMSFKGKVRIINELMWLRTAEEPSNSAGFEVEFHSWYLNPRYAAEVSDFLDITASGLAEKSELDLDVIRRGLEIACKAYVDYCHQHFSSTLSDQRLLRGPNWLGRWLSTRTASTLKRSVKKLIGALPAPLLMALPARLRFRSYIEMAKGLESAGLRVDWDQLTTILETVRKFHGTKT